MKGTITTLKFLGYTIVIVICFMLVYHPLTSWHFIAELFSPKSVSSHRQSSDTTDILKNLCQRPITNTALAATGLKIVNFLPCAWREDSLSEKKGAASAYSEVSDSGIIAAALIVKDLPDSLAESRLKDFSMERTYNFGEQSEVIYYKESSLSGLDCGESVYKINDIVKGVSVITYLLQFETMYKKKYLTLSYSVAFNDATQSKKVFYNYLTIFRTLSQKFKVSD